MRKIRVIIVDDNIRELEYLRYLLEEEKDIEIVREVSSGLEAIRLCRELAPDVVFLDIRMPDIDGLQVAGQLKQKGNPPLIVFVTGYIDYAVDGYGLDAVDFLVKPITQGRISSLVKRLKEKIKQRRRQGHHNKRLHKHLLLNLGGNMIAVSPDEIICFFCSGRKAYYRNESGEEYQVNTLLKDMKDDLEKTGFLQANQSCWINGNRIACVKPSGDRTYKVIMNDCSKTCVTLSRRCAQGLGYMKGLKERIKGFMKGK